MDENPDLVCEVCVKLGIEVVVESKATHIELHLNAEFDNSTNVSQAQMHNLCFPNEESKVVCDDCDMEFSSKAFLEDHINSEHLKSKAKKVVSSKSKSCGFCGKSFKWSYTRIRHEKAVHLKLKPFHCRFCQISFSQNSARIVHENAIHKKLKVSCTICGTKFSSNSSRITHERTVHTKDKSFSCEICGQKFTQNANRIRHQQTVHMKEKNFSCGICHKKFSNKHDQIRHEITVHSNEKNFPCTICHKSFKEKSSRIHHQKKCTLSSGQNKSAKLVSNS